MATFVDGYGNDLYGFPKINLDLVQVLRSRKLKDGENVYDCYGADGEAMGTIATCDVPTINAKVIPNTQPIQFIGFCMDDDGTLIQFKMPVIGWTVEEDTVFPVIPDGRPSSYEYCCLTDGNVYWWPESFYYTHEDILLAKATAHLTETIKRCAAVEAQDASQVAAQLSA